MSFVAVTAGHGIIIRCRAFTERGVPPAVLTALELDEPFGADEELLTFGPSFGPEALEAFTQRLIALGLVYFDDFLFASDLPLWCKFAITFVSIESE